MRSGEDLTIYHKIYFTPESSDTEYSDLLKQSPEEIKALYIDSIEKESQLYTKISSLVEKWDGQAALTKTLRSALEYVETPQVKHTSNTWVKKSYDGYEISNMVYFMRYNISEQKRFDSIVGASRPSAWFVSWSFGYNRPHPYGRENKFKLEEENQRRFKSKAAADGYIQKQIEAHENKFMELSPPIPEADENFFHVKHHLVPGYTVAPHEPTPDELLDFVDGLDPDDESGARTEPPEAAPERASKNPAHKEKRQGPVKRGRTR